ncbi:serine/threonine-protein kinase [Paratractidigestivibacter sp.]|uniref:serine/threonine-protein kinase n=1 Tax=Paratractidigestivibacter sp. TaxID=2847316 RepID=UPI002AC937D2|nr:serine/threonine-protein kinase [Paratractidigestivibacter sp.]
MGNIAPTPTPLVNGQMNQPQPAAEMLLGRYRVLARRGTGGFGTVCTCWDTRLQRRVAIKRMPLVGAGTGTGASGANEIDGSAAIGASTVDEVLLEARTACLLAHPNIVSVLDFEISGSYAYLIMEYVDGLNLAELLARVEGGRLTHDEVAHILLSCARALAFAHENRVLHMDIKPTNIMIDRMGTVKLADLGMAELGAAAGYGGARGGTVGYMPPEQIEGMLVDERADVFSLAVVLWQSLTGNNPFMAQTPAESLEKIYRGPRISGGEKDGRGRSRANTRAAATETDLDLDIEDALVRAMAAAASERTSSVDELAAELAPALGDAADGQASLAELIEQSERDDETDDAGWGRKHLAFHLRVPQAWAVAERVIPVLAVLACGVAVAPAFEATLAIKAAAVAAAVALSALWPPAGSALAGAAWAVATATTDPVSSSFTLASALGVAVAAWWAAVGRDENMATAALLAPWACRQPLAGAQLAGFCLDPAPAAATGAASYLIGIAAVACAEAGFQANIAADVVLIALSRPTTWLFAAASALAAWISSLVAMRGTVASGIVGQALGAAVLAGSAILKVRVENSGLWGAQDWAALAVALICFLLMCILTVLRGPLYSGPESEDTDELP